MSGSDSLPELLQSYFSVDELKMLCYQLGINYEELPPTGITGVALALVHLCEQRGLVRELIEQARLQRPHVNWPDPDRVLAKAAVLGKQPKPPLPYEPETVEVAAGVFLMGSQPGENVPAYEMPQHPVELAAYSIGKYPVTNVQYGEFIKQTRRPAPRGTGWFGSAPPRDKLDHPVSGISWYDGLAYCQWLSEQSGRTYRLPTEAEWEKAARGNDGRIYPWGDEWEPGRCNHSGDQTTPVTAFPGGCSPYGCLDMIGNTGEWTSTLWGPDWQQPDFPYPYQAGDGRENLQAAPTSHRIFRGGSFGDKLSRLRCGARLWYAPAHQDRRRGFRVVRGDG